MSKKKKGLKPEGAVKMWHEMTPEERVAVLKDKHKEYNAKKGYEAYTSYVRPPECHTGNLMVFNDPESGLKFTAGGTSRGAKWFKNSLVIDLCEGFEQTIKIEGINSPELNKIACVSPRIAITWRDYGIPHLDREDWVGIVKGLREGRRVGEIPQEILVCCVGGHGRTGTAVAILAGLMGVTNGKDPVEWVRGRYCKNAVESNEQLDYVEEVTQIEVKIGLPESKRGGVVVYGGGGVTKTYPNHSYGMGYDYDIPMGKVEDTQKEVVCKKCQGPKVAGKCLGCQRFEDYCGCE